MVGVVGASHLSGMQRLWDSSGWREMVAGGLLEAPQGPPVPESPDATGVRWAAAARGAQRQAQLQGRAGGARATPSSERPWTDALAGTMRWHGLASNPSAGGWPLRMCAAGRWPAWLLGPASALPPLPRGRRRALLDGVIRLSCRTDVQQDVRRVLGPVPAESAEAYSLAHELYGTTRMLLAVLEREQLEEVCQVRGCAVRGRSAGPLRPAASCSPPTRTMPGRHAATCMRWPVDLFVAAAALLRRYCSVAPFRPACGGHKASTWDSAAGRASRPTRLDGVFPAPAVSASSSQHLAPLPCARRAGVATCGMCWRRCARCGPSTAALGERRGELWAHAGGCLRESGSAPRRAAVGRLRGKHAGAGTPYWRIDAPGPPLV